MLEAMKNAQHGALEAVRAFATSIDQALPLHREGASQRQEVIDSALGMADRLVQTQYDFLITLIRSAGKSLGAMQPEQKQEIETAPPETNATQTNATETNSTETNSTEKETAKKQAEA
jgi:hypothetical protein